MTKQRNGFMAVLGVAGGVALLLLLPAPEAYDATH